MILLALTLFVFVPVCITDPGFRSSSKPDKVRFGRIEIGVGFTDPLIPLYPPLSGYSPLMYKNSPDLSEYLCINQTDRSRAPVKSQIFQDIRREGRD